MSILFVTAPDEETGMVAAITDLPCPGEGCGWPELVAHIEKDGTTELGCPNCEAVWPVERFEGWE